jgi:hypothetical protein
MKTILFACVLLCDGCATPSSPAEDAAPDVSPSLSPLGKPVPSGGRRITLDCGEGERATATGSYGGVPVSLSCSRGRASSTVITPSGNAYDFRVGVEGVIAVDAHPVGDAETFSYQYLGTTFAATLP